MEIDRRLQAIFQAVFGPQIPRLAAQDSPETVEGWDSLNHVNLMLALEGEFGVQFDAAEIADLVTVGAIRERLARSPIVTSSW